MTFLKKLFRGAPSWPPDGPITTWPRDSFDGRLRAIRFDVHGRSTVDVVGESAFQGSLEIIAGGRTVDGARNRDHVAVLLPEPFNRYDPDAVRVAIVPSETSDTWGYVGYLSREDAVAYRPVIERLAKVGKIAACYASITGGWDRGNGDRGSFGVRLHVGTPDEMMAELEDDSENLRPAWDAESS